MSRRLALGFFLLIGCCIAIAAPNFPALTGRVVDSAHLLTPQVVQELESKLEQYEQATTNQVVVLTLPTLNGYAIDDYGYQLGRFWQIGQKGKNNGAVLIVAAQEHKVRIEVGYGLEPILTDLLANSIIQNVIIPSFKKEQYQQGIIDGTQAIIDVLGGAKVPQAKAKSDKTSWWEWLFLLIIILVLIRNPSLALLIFSGSGQRFGGRSGGRFGGGGGSFGGGGSSGSW